MIALIIVLSILLIFAMLSIALAMLGIYATHKTMKEWERDNL